jgi:hypothetical protein
MFSTPKPTPNSSTKTTVATGCGSRKSIATPTACPATIAAVT